jgi:4-alpha-glucanotransferase
VYVRYPREELLAVIAAEAARTATTIVGENLGTVPEQVTEALERWKVIGMFEEQFHLYDRNTLPPVPADSVAGIRTHDMPAFAAAFGDDAADLLDAALERLARSDAFLVVADLDDLVGETAPHNVPGKVLPSTWRRRLRAPTSEVLADECVRRRLALLVDRKVR